MVSSEYHKTGIHTRSSQYYVLLPTAKLFHLLYYLATIEQTHMSLNRKLYVDCLCRATLCTQAQYNATVISPDS